MGLSHVTLWDFSLTIHDSNMFLECVQVKSTWIKSIWKFRKRISHIAIIKPVYYFLLQHQFINENQFNIYIYLYYTYTSVGLTLRPPLFFSRGVVYISCVKNLMRRRDILTPRSMSGPDATTRCLIMLDNRPPWNEKRLQRRQRGEKGRFFGFREIDGIIENAWKWFFLAKGLYDTDIKDWIGWDLDCMFIISRSFMMFQPYSVLTLLTPSELAVFSTLT